PTAVPDAVPGAETDVDATPEPTATATAQSPALLPLAATPAPTVSPTAVASASPEADDDTPAEPLRVTAFGDSVMLGAAQALARDLPNIKTDAAVSRPVSAGIEIVRTRHQMGQLGDVVVVHLGNNGPFSSAEFDTLMNVLSDVPRVVIINLKVPRTWEAPNNSVLADGVQRFP